MSANQENESSTAGGFQALLAIELDPLKRRIERIEEAVFPKGAGPGGIMGEVEVRLQALRDEFAEKEKFLDAKYATQFKELIEIVAKLQQAVKEEFAKRSIEKLREMEA